MIWVAHPKENSFCEALADSYQAGAKEAGAEVRFMRLADMNFDANAQSAYEPDRPKLEPDLIAWQEAIIWADHLMIVHPYWWGGMPGQAKVVFDRALTPGFAFKYHEGKKLTWDKLLKGKTMEGIITSDAPPLLDSLLFKKPGRQVLKKMIFEFCGVKVKKIHQFGSVKTSSVKQRQAWLNKVRQLGEKVAR